MSAYTTTSIWYILFFLRLFQLVNFVRIQRFFNDLLKERSHFSKLVLSQKEKKIWKIPTKTSIRVGHHFADIVLRILLTFSENFFNDFRKPLDECFRNYRNGIYLFVLIVCSYTVSKQINRLVSIWYEFLLKGISKQHQKNVWSSTS